MTSQKQKSTSSPSSQRPKRKPGSTKRAPQPKRVALAKMKDDLSRYLRLAASEEIVITRHGRPAGVLIGFESEEDWFEYRLEHHPEFLARIREARAAIDAGRGVRLEDLAE
jgi:prevent-host-death family protein